jgi:hypothetical protein
MEKRGIFLLMLIREKLMEKKECIVDRKKIAKELLKLANEIEDLRKEDETIKQLERTDPDEARKVMSVQLNKLIELNKRQETLFKKFKKAVSD